MLISRVLLTARLSHHSSKTHVVAQPKATPGLIMTGILPLLVLITGVLEQILHATSDPEFQIVNLIQYDAQMDQLEEMRTFNALSTVKFVQLADR